MDRPFEIRDRKYRYDSFANGEVFEGKKQGRLPAMGWNSWNAFGSGNTEKLTVSMAEKIVELGLDKLGYEYVVLDDGCYRSERVNGLLANETEKFPSGFRALADIIHSKGLKFGMYNDIGTNLCAGAAVGTCGHEMIDAKSYHDWGVDFIKVDNCYYLWDNATFSNAENARYTYAPRIKAIVVRRGENVISLLAENDGILSGEGAYKENGYAAGIGTFDGTGPDRTPVGEQSGELHFKLETHEEGWYELTVNYGSGKEPGCGEWLQVAVDGTPELFYDDLLAPTENRDTFSDSDPVRIYLKKGNNIIRLMNHRRQENTLCSYAELLKGFYAADKEKSIVLSICEWGKTQPQNWGYKVGDSWRILNDITFQVGADGNPGHGAWESDYTTSVCAQYNKAVIMDEFAGPDKGWNDPDMLMVGMDGLDMTMCNTHFTMWCLMNSPLMLGLDLRRVSKGDDIYNIISNKEIIALNRDPLGVQAKRVYSTKQTTAPDKEYIRDNERVDILAKPLCDGSIAVSFINLSQSVYNEEIGIDLDTILAFIGGKMAKPFAVCDGLKLRDLWTGEEKEVKGNRISVCSIPACGNITYKISPAGV